MILLKNILLILFINLLFLFISEINAIEIDNENQLNKRLATLIDESETSPYEKLSEIEYLLSIATKFNWIKSITRANANKAEVLINLEEISTAKSIVNTYLPLALQQNLPNIVIELEIVQLKIEDARGYSSKLLALRNKLLKKANTVNVQKLLAKIFLEVSQSQYLSKEYSLSISNVQKSHEIFVQINDPQGLSTTLNSFANLYSALGQENTALEYLQEALKIIRNLNDPINESIVLYNIGKAQMKLGNVIFSRKSYFEALALSDSLLDEVGAAWTKMALANIHLTQREPIKALDLYINAFNIFELSGDNRMKFNATLGKVEAFIQLKQYAKARVLLTQLKPSLTTLNSNSFSTDFYKILTMLEQNAKNYKAALEAQNTYISLKEVMDKKQKMHGIERLLIQFDSNKKENTNRGINRSIQQ